MYNPAGLICLISMCVCVCVGWWVRVCINVCVGACVSVCTVLLSANACEIFWILCVIDSDCVYSDVIVEIN